MTDSISTTVSKRKTKDRPDPTVINEDEIRKAIKE